MRRDRVGAFGPASEALTSIPTPMTTTTPVHACRLFNEGERVAVAISGGKDSTVLAHILTTLNARHGYGLQLFLLAVDEGIQGYRDDSLETVHRNEEEYGVPLKVVSYEEMYGGWSMDRVVEAVGRTSNCTFCGVLRRQALDRGADIVGVDKIVTGHNADDVAETVLLNILRGDAKRLGRSTQITTGLEGVGTLPRCKPLKYTYEKEIVMYAHFKKLDYFSTECTYSPGAFRGVAREFVKDLEAIRPSSIADIIRSGEAIRVTADAAAQRPGKCVRCGYMSSQRLCKACILIEGLNRGKPKLGLSKQAQNACLTASEKQSGARERADGR